MKAFHFFSIAPSTIPPLSDLRVHNALPSFNHGFDFTDGAWETLDGQLAAAECHMAIKGAVDNSLYPDSSARSEIGRAHV